MIFILIMASVYFFGIWSFLRPSYVHVHVFQENLMFVSCFVRLYFIFYNLYFGILVFCYCFYSPHSLLSFKPTTLISTRLSFCPFGSGRVPQQPLSVMLF